MKIIQFSDTHLELEIFTQNRLQNLRKFINENHSDAFFCIATGDLVNKELPIYKELKKEFNSFKMPVFGVIGNHDNRSDFRKNFKHYQFLSKEKCFYEVVLENKVFLFLDTKRDGFKGGKLGEEQLNWLKDRLLVYRKKDVFIVMHHHFFKSYNASLDCMDLEDKDIFVEIISGWDNIKHIFLGHLHMNLLGKYKDISYSSVRSVKFQISYDETSISHTTENVKPSICIINIENENMSIFYQDVELD